MKYKVKIKKLPEARMGYQVNGALKNDIAGLGGNNYNSMRSSKSMNPQKSIGKVPREEANLEAEGGETVLGDINFDGFPEHYTIKGPRHAQGGVPLKLPEDTFIFSDFREMKINDPDLLEKFGKVVKKAQKQKAYTPAQLAKQYDINHYRSILQDPDSDYLDRKTAELMIRNYNMKLGALALAQESKKGFPQGIPMIAQPFMEANGLSEEDFIPQEEEAAQAEMAQGPMQQDAPMPGGEGMPTQMPNGAPIAMPQPMEGQPQMDPTQMMMSAQMTPEDMGQAPMAQYGMAMGGFYPEYAFGGANKYPVRIKQLPQAKTGNPKLKNRTALEKKRLEENKNRTYNKSKEGEGWIDLGNGEWGRGTRGGIDVKIGDRGSVVKGGPGYTKEDVCAWMKSEGGSYYGATAEQMIAAGIAHSSTLSFLKGCEVVDEEMEFYKDEGSGKECVCKDKDGKDIVTPLDKDGKCPCEEEVKKCYCLDEKGMKMEVPCGPNGTEPDCPGGMKGEAMGQGRPPAKYWIQDTRNSVNAFMDRMRLKKYLPYSARVDLEEGRPYWLDPTRQYAALGERAATEVEGNAAFAGPQQLAARNAASQAGTLQGIADIGSNVNNQNVNIANTWDQTKTGIRNQENLLRGEAETKDYMGTTIANQQYDNALGQLADNQTLAANTADTNKYKTDALNQMYPNYQVDPSVGGQMYYNPTQKDPNPIKPEDEIEYAQQLKGSGLDPDVQRVMMANWYKSRGTDNSVAPDPNVVAAMYGQKGGVMFRDGGFIYMAWPEVM